MSVGEHFLWRLTVWERKSSHFARRRFPFIRFGLAGSSAPPPSAEHPGRAARTRTQSAQSLAVILTSSSSCSMQSKVSISPRRAAKRSYHGLLLSLLHPPDSCSQCKKKKKSNALVQARFLFYFFPPLFFKPCNFGDSASCPCDTRKCLTPIVARQKVVLIPL